MAISRLNEKDEQAKWEQWVSQMAMLSRLNGDVSTENDNVMQAKCK